MQSFESPDPLIKINSEYKINNQMNKFLFTGFDFGILCVDSLWAEQGCSLKLEDISQFRNSMNNKFSDKFIDNLYRNTKLPLYINFLENTVIKKEYIQSDQINSIILTSNNGWLKGAVLGFFFDLVGFLITATQGDVF